MKKDQVTFGWFHSLDARAKIVGVLSLTIATALLTDPLLILGSFAFAIALACVSGANPRLLMKSYALSMPVVAAASLSMLLLSGPGPALAMLARTSACIVPLLVLAAGTESFDLFRGLRNLKVPAIMTTLIMLTHRFVLLFVEELDRMRTARRARGFMGGRNLLDRYGLHILSSTAGMMLVRADLRAGRVYDGMRSRGFQRDLIRGTARRIGLLDFAFASGFASFAAILATCQFGGLV